MSKETTKFPNIFVGIPVRNAGKWLPNNIEQLEGLTYPKDKLRIVYSYSRSNDDTLEILKKFAKDNNMKSVEIYNEPYDVMLKKHGIQMGAEIYKDFQKLIDEDYFMLFDSDLCEVPGDIIEQLLEIKEDIVAPFPWNENYTHFYDSVTSDTPIIIRRNRKLIDIIPINQLDYECLSDIEVLDYKTSKDTSSFSWTNVKAVTHHKVTNGYVRKVITLDGMVEVTPNHSIYKREQPDGLKLVESNSLKIGDVLSIRKLYRQKGDKNYFYAGNKDMAWLSGLFVAHGHASLPKGNISISNNNINVLKKAMRILNNNFYPSVHLVEKEETGKSRVETCSPNLALYFRERCYTLNKKKRIPIEILNAPLEIKKAFLDGYKAGDGIKSNSRYVFTTDSKVEAEGLIFLLQRLNYPNYMLSFRDDKPDVITIISNKTNNRRKPRKCITKIVDIHYTGNVYDITTESNRFYAGLGPILVHNTWIFRLGNKRFHPLSPPGLGMKVPIEADAVGTLFLSTKEAFKNTPIFNPYPNLSLCFNARRRGYRVLTAPYIEVFHRDMRDEPPHNPLPPEIGSYPSPGWATALDPVIDIDGNIQQPYTFPFDDNKEIEGIEREIALKTLKMFYTTPFFLERNKSLLWAYNYMHFSTFWMTRNTGLIDLMYRTEMYPRYIEVELSNLCNYRCQHCELPFWKNVEQRNMTWEELMVILNNFPDLKQMAFVGIGNPWLNPIFLDAVKYVKKERDLFFELYDPFQNFDTPTVKKFIKWGVERLFVSLDSATKETYEVNRKGHKWDKMIEGVKLFNKYKRKYNAKYPEINFHFVIDKSNIHEALDCIDFVKSLNIDNGFIQYSRLLHCFDEIKDLYVDIPKDLCAKIMAKAKKEKIPVAWNADVEECLPSMNLCNALWQPGFLATGEVTVCCAVKENNTRNWERLMSMGNIFKENDFKKIWYGERYRKLRQQIREGKCPEPCSTCPIFQLPNKIELWDK